MAIALRELFLRIADSIRSMDSTGELIPAETFPDRIRAIPQTKDTPTPTEITILTPPNKTSYEGTGWTREDFDPTGMTFRVKMEASGIKITLPDITDISNMVDNKIYVNMDQFLTDVIIYFPTPTPYLTFEPFKELVPGTDHIDVCFYYGSEVLRMQQPITCVHVDNTWGDIVAQGLTWAEMDATYGNWITAATYNNWPDGK